MEVNLHISLKCVYPTTVEENFQLYGIQITEKCVCQSYYIININIYYLIFIIYIIILFILFIMPPDRTLAQILIITQFPRHRFFFLNICPSSIEGRGWGELSLSRCKQVILNETHLFKLAVKLWEDG